MAVYLRDITGRKHSEAALRRLNEDLKQFTFAATHDLREPLRMMTVNVQMLERRLGAHLDQEGRNYILQIVNGAKRISRLIDGLLEFSRLGEENRANPVPVDTTAALAEVLEILQILISETETTVTHSDLPKVMANHVHICQLFQNLVENAVKYRRPDIAPAIWISARKNNTDWVFGIHDNGIGIPAEYCVQIFVPFKRLHGAEVSGAGIGLATCKRIVERYHGRIWVESEEGSGSVFYFSLPEAENEKHGDI